ncbi:MAG: molybdopterin-dependent oxidoreductase [Bacteroidia bacterium]|nr:molybdopterin-dependent oxidoreductase [Bacteroidia bacterium]
MIKTTYNRRSFLKVSAATGGGMLLGFNWLAGCSTPAQADLAKALPSQWYPINAYLKIGDTGLVTIISPNPEIGQGVKTSMPMIVAEELDVEWKDVVVEQGNLDTGAFTRQVAGGSQSIRQSWDGLRTAGATARQMLLETAAARWGVAASACTVANGIITSPTGEKLGYGELAAEAATATIPEEVALKDPKDYTIIGKGKRNVDIPAIVTGKPLYGIDTQREGMVVAAMMRPPGFGQTLVSFDDSAARAVEGVIDVVRIGDKIAVIASSTWPAFKAKKLIQATWKSPELIHSSAYISAELSKLAQQRTDKPSRNDGDVDEAFAAADKILEREYEGPFLPHNCMEPMNFYADVRDDAVELHGPIQTPEGTRKDVAELLGRPESEISIGLTRMGGGFGRRLFSDFVIEAVEISREIKKPVKLVYTREDDMTAGVYRPAATYRIKAAIKEGQLSAYHISGAIVNLGLAVFPDRFPAGLISNYRVDNHNFESPVTFGYWRAPISNYLATADQMFQDELAKELGKDPIEFRLELLRNAKGKVVGEIEYDLDKSIRVMELVLEKSNWDKTEPGVKKGFSYYYSHNTHVAEVAHVRHDDGEPRVENVTCAIECGIVVNPMGAMQQAQGGVIDGLGHHLYGRLTLDAEGIPEQNNFHQFRLIRMKETPQVEVHFVPSTESPTGLGEPTLPPISGAVANAGMA